MVEVELAFLFEVGRVSGPPSEVLDDLRANLGLAVSDAPFAAVSRAAVGLTWTRDPFDRLIAAQSIVDRAPLVTADETILGHLPTAVWG
jgi:PIN domain nuclease of toxin-antitoxin system